MKYGVPLSVTSEIGRLREVIVHTPGREIEMVTPRNFGRMLFDDILYLKEVAKDHDCLVQILKKAGIVVYYFQDLLAETLHLIGYEGRRKFVELVSRLEGYSPDYCKQLSDYSPEGLADVLIGGEPRGESLTRFLRQDIYVFPPLPNLMFVRDCATVVGDGVIMSSMAHAVRSREILLFDLIFSHHSRFCREGIAPWRWLGDFESRLTKREMVRGHIGFEHVSLEGTNFKLSSSGGLSIGGKEYVGMNTQIASGDSNVTLEANYVRFTQGPHYTLEGGNIFVLSSDTLLIGCGHRASAAAIDTLVKELFERRSKIRTVLVAIIADDKKNHLDTFFSIAGKDQYMIYPSIMEEYGAQLTMLKMWLDKGQICVKAYDSMKEAMESVGLKYDCQNVGYCAGVGLPHDEEVTVEKRILQEREWHNQALNMLALAPGKLIASERNQETLRYLEDKWGYKIIRAETFLDAEQTAVEECVESDSRIVITLDDSELSRAHGGPRSLVLPIRRDDVPLRRSDMEDRLSSVHVKSSQQETETEQPRPAEPNATDPKEIRLDVHSETGCLRQVVLHRPGQELAYLTPTNKTALLYDDILDLKTAQKEHRDFWKLLTALGIKVYEIEDLVLRALRDIERLDDVLDKVVDLQREAVKERGGKWLPSYGETLKARLKECWEQGAEELTRALIEGVPADSSHPALFLDDADPFLLTPIPNILFMRDPAAVVGDNAIVCYMQKPARLREGLLLHYALQALVKQDNIERQDLWFDFFSEIQKAKEAAEKGPEKANEIKGGKGEAGKKLEKVKERGKLQRIEGGDILVIHDHILAIGCSERTTREMLEELATQLFEKQKDDDPRIEEIFVVLMPAQRSTMHLDTIFTMLSEDECLVYQPMIVPEGIEQVRVVRLTADRDPETQELKSIKTYEVNSLVKELEEAIRHYEGAPNYRLKSIFVGGDNPLYQDREQLCDGANVLAVAPGVVIGYERNYRTFQELEKAGYQVCHAHDVVKVENEELKLTELGEAILETMEASIPRDNSYRRDRRKYAIEITGRELSRARGGPRCMSMPLSRERISWDRSGR